MYNKSIHSKIEVLGQVISDIKEIEYEMQITNDPSLIEDLTEEKNELIMELDMIGVKCITLIEAYMEDCKDNDYPIFLDYYRVLKELKKAELR